MDILHRKEFVLGTILLLAVGHCAAVAKRDVANADAEVNDLSLAELPDQVARIPKIGPPLRDLLNHVGELLMVVSQILNAVIARLLGGSLPCELGNEHVTCSGTSKEGGLFGIVEELVDQLTLPTVMKRMMLDVIKRTVNPAVDTLLGGLPLPKKQIKTTNERIL